MQRSTNSFIDNETIMRVLPLAQLDYIRHDIGIHASELYCIPQIQIINLQRSI